MVNTTVTPLEKPSAPLEQRHSASSSEAPKKRALLESIALGLVRALSAVPLSLRSVTGWGIGYVVGLIPFRERRIASLQLQRHLPNLSAARYTPRVFANAGRVALESLNLDRLTKNGAPRISCSTWPAIRTWLEDARPIVALTGHTGNWDLLAAYMIAQGIPLATIGKEAKNPVAQRILESIRKQYGIETIWRSDRGGVKRLMSCLRERTVVAALIDQDTRVESVFVPFFGTPVKTPVALIGLGRKCGARFVSTFIFRTGFLRFEVFVEEFSDNLSEEELLTEYNRRLEALIRRFPDQWVWFHKRWRSTSDGNTLSSRQYEETLRRSCGERST